MSDSLDVTAPVVPEAPPAAPAPQAAPEPQDQKVNDDALPIDPGAWLDDAERVAQYVASGQSQQAPQVGPTQMPQYTPQYPPHQPSYPPAPAQKPREIVERQLATFIDDPDAWVDQLVERRLEQRLAPILGQVGNAYNATNSLMQSQAKAGISNARRAIERAYDQVFNQDDDFLSNPRIQTEVGKMLDNMFQEASVRAYHGDFGPIMSLSYFTPEQAKGALGAAKGMWGTGSPGGAPINMVGGQVESSTAHPPGVDMQLEPWEESAIAFHSRTNPNYRQEYMQKKREAIDAGDFEF